MLKKIGLASTILLTTSTIACAQTAAPVPSPAQTAGAQAAGIESPTAPPVVTQPTSQTTTENTKPAHSSYYLGVGLSLLNVRAFTALMPKFYAGYDTVLGKNCKFFWGTEVFIGTGSWRLSPNAKYRVTALAGASVLPGFKWNEWTALFARFGAQTVYFQQIDSTKTGGLVGVGFQSYQFGHWYLRGEYDYNFVKNFSQYNLDFLYKFC